MKNQQLEWTHRNHSEIKLDDPGNQNFPARQTSHFQGSSRSLDSISEELEEVFGECQVARNAPSVQEGESIKIVGTAIFQTEKISLYETKNEYAIQNNDGENKKVYDNTSEKNGEVEGEQLDRSVPLIVGNVCIHDVNTTSESYNLQVLCPPDSNQCYTEESTQVLRRDILDNKYFSSEENKCKFGIIANENFLEKPGSSENDARHHPAKLNPAQAFVHLSKPMSILGAEKHCATYGESIGVHEEYLRRDSEFRDEKGVTRNQRISGNMRPRSRLSQGVNTSTFWLIIAALFMTFSTAVLVVILWEHLSVVSLERKPCFNSSKIPIIPDIVFPKTW